MILAYQDIKKFARENERPFVAVVIKAGNIYARMNHLGNVNGEK